MFHTWPWTHLVQFNLTVTAKTIYRVNIEKHVIAYCASLVIV